MAIPIVSTTGFKTFVKPSANFHSAADRFSQLSFVIISDDTDFFNANNLSTIAKSLSHLVEQDIMESYSYRCFFFLKGMYSCHCHSNVMVVADYFMAFW